jgi:uncharacterized UPF0146 family protein
MKSILSTFENELFEYSTSDHKRVAQALLELSFALTTCAINKDKNNVEAITAVRDNITSLLTDIAYLLNVPIDIVNEYFKDITDKLKENGKDNVLHTSK